MATVERPLASVVIPAFNQAAFLGAAVRSVLAQSLRQVEAIVVDDGSTDDTVAVAESFGDDRVRLMRHDGNRGLPAARNTGMRAARADVIAFLDADDLFTPDKLAAHLQFLERHPGVAITYNGRFEFVEEPAAVRSVWMPPPVVGLADVVVGFPFSPSDMVIRREAAAIVGGWDEEARWGAEDVDFPCRLALAAQRFARVPGVLNLRRRYRGRPRRHLARRVADYQRALDHVFDDPRCPGDVRALAPAARRNRLVEVALVALAQGETDLGQQCLVEAVATDPNLVAGSPPPLAEDLAGYLIIDDREDLDALLDRILDQCPSAAGPILEWRGWTAGHAHLHRGIRAVVWGATSGRTHFQRAAALGASPSPAFVGACVAHVVNCDAALGRDAAHEALARLVADLRSWCAAETARRLQGEVHANLGFRDDSEGRPASSLRSMSRAVAHDPRFLANRGVVAVLARSAWRSTFGQEQR